FTLTSSTANSQYTVTATLNNPPTTPPTSVTFTVAGQTFTETLTNGQATLTLAVHPSVATEQINVSVSASGCVGASINIGGSGTDVALQVVTPCGGTPTVGPAGANAVQFLQTYYAVNSTTVEALLTNIATGMSLLNDAVFNVILPALQATTYTPVTLSADQSNTFSDMKTNLLPNLFTTLANGYPIGGTEQMQFAAFVKNFQNAAANVTNFMQALQTFNL
ncbi:hypothetical protein, partial [Alicyclobacillus suci]|uniref:hypothetical protein n=1 Tax=Alicyclobacillus suci TaxID=2816080 RepID=UPI001A8FB2F9